jgi:IS605 OrfB family transposase
MKTTIKIKLLPSKEQHVSLKETLKVFNEACNDISKVSRANGTTSKFALQKLVYHRVKKQYNLTAQAVIRAIAKVIEAYKRDRTKLCTFKPYSAMVYDQRILRFKGLDTVNMWVVGGRQDFSILLGGYQKARMDRVKGQVDLLFINNEFYLMATVESPEKPPIETDDFLGVDLGIYNIASDSSGKKFSGKKVEAVRRTYQKRRASLQSKGTKSAKRRLKRMSGKEKRFKRDINHQISKRIVEKAKGTRSSIVLEDLKGIRKNVKRLGKPLRSMIGGWAFNQLRQFIEYKAVLEGIPVIIVSPLNTSRECSVCGYTDKENRKTQEVFMCLRCGHQENADLNAAKVIRSRAFVKKPIVAGDRKVA